VAAQQHLLILDPLAVEVDRVPVRLVPLHQALDVELRVPVDLTSMAAPGTTTPAGLLLLEGISRCCGMRTSMAARGTISPASGPLPDSGLLVAGISRCCGMHTGMHTSMAARGATTPDTLLGC
jgi:hypothetical protein